MVRRIPLLATAAVLATHLAVAGSTQPIGVEELMRAGDKAPSPVTLDGVVSQVFPDRHLLALIDAEEFSKCRVVTCANLTLPVEWSGAMPEVASTVRVEGSVRKQGIRLLFAATSLETTAPPPGSP